MRDYIEQYKKLHKQCKYGKSSEKLYDEILPLIKEINPKSILDYGCGQSKLIEMLPCEKRYRYDPAIEKYSILPTTNQVDLVLCIDVLEHIPLEDLNETLVMIRHFSDNVIFDIGIQSATHILPNGQNAHCTVKTIEWWVKYLKTFFPIVTFVKNIREVKFLCKTWK